jgi:hypothetical protein
MRTMQGILLGVLVWGAVAAGATEVFAVAGPAGGMHMADCNSSPSAVSPNTGCSGGQPTN